jgi:CheY-like chemotaxis protein
MNPFVLVVDDDEAIRTVMAEVLRVDGHEVLCASDGAEALALMRCGRVPELVVLDLMMPNVTGLQVLEAMGESPRLAAVPVVVLTAFDARDDLPAGRPALHKPIEAALLLDLVRALLEQDRKLAFALEEAPSDLMPRPSDAHTHPAKGS